MPSQKSRNGTLAGQVGARVFALRLERGLTVRKLAEIADCSVQTVCNVESGISGGTTTTLRKIALALRVELFDLFNVDVQTDDMGYVIEKMRHDSALLRLVLDKFDRNPSPVVLRARSSVPVSCTMEEQRAPS